MQKHSKQLDQGYTCHVDIRESQPRPVGPPRTGVTGYLSGRHPLDRGARRERWWNVLFLMAVKHHQRPRRKYDRLDRLAVSPCP